MSRPHLDAAKIISSVWQRKGSLRKSLYDDSVDQKGTVKALALETLKHSNLISLLFNAVPDLVRRLSDEMPRTEAARATQVWRPFAFVVGYDLLFGRGPKHCGGGAVKRCLMEHKAGLEQALQTMADDRGASSVGQFVADFVSSSSGSATDGSRGGAALPRYVRVNTLLTDVATVEAELNSNYSFEYTPDPDVPGLLRFPTGTDLHDCPLATNGHLVLQDKASCLTALALNPEPGSHCIDCCAAPGNKTVQLASQVGPTGRVFAFDRDPERLKVLDAAVDRTGAAAIVRSQCKDFLSVQPTDAAYADVRYVLCDPSCSGSGIAANALTDANQQQFQPVQQREFVDEAKRLRHLAAFQRRILLHCLSFPNVERVAYSTCSVNEEENERVVHQTLNHPDVKYKFRLALALPEWTGQRGYTEDYTEEMNRCVRTSAATDETNGFFVALFERHQREPTAQELEQDNELKQKKKASQKRSRANSNSNANVATAPKKKKKKTQPPPVQPVKKGKKKRAIKQPLK